LRFSLEKLLGVQNILKSLLTDRNILVGKVNKLQEFFV